MPEVLRASCRSGVLIIPKSARLLNLEGCLIDATGVRPGSRLPYALNVCAGAKPSGKTQRTNPGIVLPTYLTTKVWGGQKL